MAKKAILLRAGPETIRKIEELAKKRQSTKSEILTIAIDKVYQLEIEKVAA